MNNFNLFFTQEIAESISNNTVSDEIKEVIKSIYRKVFRKEMNSSCSNCFTDSFFELYNLWKSDLSKFPALFNCEYQLRFGEVLSQFGSSDNIGTRVNMTDALAVMYLSINKNNARLFEVLPDDWESQVKDYEASKIVEPVTPEEIDEVKVDVELPEVLDEVPMNPIIVDVDTTADVPTVPKGKNVITPIVEPVTPEETPETPTDSNNEVGSK